MADGGGRPIESWAMGPEPKSSEREPGREAHGLLTGRPWDRTPFWVKLPRMILGAVIALTAFIVIGVVGVGALGSDTDSTPDVQAGPGE
ncbi:hypothetical protein [Corallococcus sp. EGB]|uniref:hypothetical protein n=1 Tax=Corallococcus sp. EGB TaxID=1521117 RepID=UPI001CBE6FCC|nr:hypothetical protein [Corallococcus sp. EGB]